MMAEPVEYSLRWWIKLLRDALAEGFEDDEVRRYFGMKEGDYVADADRRRLARHKARSMFKYQFVWTLIQAVADMQKKNAYGEYSALKIDGFARFFKRDNTGRSANVPKTRLYPLSGGSGRVIDREEMVQAIERAEVLQPTWSIGDELPGVVSVKMAGPTYWPSNWPGVEFQEFTYSPVSVKDLSGAHEYESVPVDLNEVGAIGPVGVWLVWVPQRLKVTTYYNGTGETKDREFGWRMPIYAEAFEVSEPASVGLGNMPKLHVVGWEPALPWESWGSAEIDGAEGKLLSDMPRVMAEIPDGWYAWNTTLSPYFGAVAWSSCFERRYWVIPTADDYGNFQYQRPVWRDAWSWWQQVGEEQAAGLVAQGYTVPPYPRAEPKRRKGVSVQFDKDFVEWLNRQPETPPAGGGAAP